MSKLHFCRKINIDSLFLLGMLCITFDSFPFYKYGLGSAKPLSIVPLILFLILKIISIVKRLKIDKGICIVLTMGILIVLQSIFCGLFIYNDDTGYSETMNIFFTFFVSILSFVLYMNDADNLKIKRMLKYIFMSFKISLFFGIIEIIYFYILDSELLKNFITLFVRDDVFLDVQYVQFNYGERGNTGVMLGILFPVVLFLLKKIGYSFSRGDKIFIIIIYAVSVLTFSINYFIIMLTLLISGIVILDFKNKNRKLLVLFLMVACFILISIVLSSESFLIYSSNSNSRILRILRDTNYIYSDGSIQTRLGQAQVCLKGFMKKPFSGYGWGYFIYAMRDNYNEISSTLKSYELSIQASLDSLQTYGFLFSVLVEGGTLGILFAISLFSRFKKTEKELWPFIIVFILECLQNVFVYWISMLVIYCLLTDKTINNIVIKNRDKEEKNDT